jgi:Ca2+-binding EF-hand superfamily protein
LYKERVMYRATTLLAATLISFAAIAQSPMESPTQATAAPTFESLDKNADKKLSASEAGADQGLAQDFSAADTNQDGYISREEFDAYHKG